MLILLFLIYLFFLSFFCLLICLGVCFLEMSKGHQQSWDQPLGSNRENVWFAPLMDSKAYGKLMWSRQPGREERARGDFSRR